MLFFLPLFSETKKDGLEKENLPSIRQINNSYFSGVNQSLKWCNRIESPNFRGKMFCQLRTRMKMFQICLKWCKRAEGKCLASWELGWKMFQICLKWCKRVQFPSLRGQSVHPKRFVCNLHVQGARPSVSTGSCTHFFVSKHWLVDPCPDPESWMP